MLTTEQRVAARPAGAHRTAIRLTTAGLCGLLGVLYLILMLLVAREESVPGATDSNTYGAYLFLAVVYLAGAVVMAITDQRQLAGIGVLVQLVVLGLFVVFGVGLLGPGVFEYAALSSLRMPLWAAAITAGQVVLVGLLGYLAVTPTGREVGSSA